MPASKDMPSTLRRSSRKARETWAKAHDAAARRGGATAGGIDANASVTHLREQARKLDVPGRSRMNRGELVAALNKASGRANAKVRGG